MTKTLKYFAIFVNFYPIYNRIRIRNVVHNVNIVLMNFLKSTNRVQKNVERIIKIKLQSCTKNITKSRYQQHPISKNQNFESLSLNNCYQITRLKNYAHQYFGIQIQQVWFGLVVRIKCLQQFNFTQKIVFLFSIYSSQQSHHFDFYNSKCLYYYQILIFKYSIRKPIRLPRTQISQLQLQSRKLTQTRSYINVMKTPNISNLLEIIQNEQEMEIAMKNRISNIKGFSSLGPPDMCYLTKNFEGTLLSMGKQKTKIGSYHFVYGLNISTPGAVSAYVNSLIKRQETQNKWFSNGEWRVSKAYYCSFDSFSRHEVHVQITIPGTVKIYAFNQDGRIVPASEKIWERAFVSSVIRAMKPGTNLVPCSVVLQQFSSIDQLEEFLKGLFSVISDFDIPLDLEEEIYFWKFNGSKALSIVIDYLLKKKYYQITYDYLHFYSKTNAKCDLFLSRLFEDANKFPEAMKNIAVKLQKFPMAPSLLYGQAQLLKKYGKYEESLKLTKVLVGLLPRHFDIWILLSEIFCYAQNFQMGLLCLNVASDNCRLDSEVYMNNMPRFLDTDDYNSQNIEKSNPKEKTHLTIFHNLIKDPSVPEVFGMKQKKNASTQNSIVEQHPQSEQMAEELRQHRALKLSEDEKKIYDILIQIEQSISWDELVKLRAEVFILHSENGYSHLGQYTPYRDYPFLGLQEQKEMELYQQEKFVMPNQGGDQSSSGGNNTSNTTSNSSQAQKPSSSVLPQFADSDESDEDEGDGKLPNFLKEDVPNPDENQYQQALQKKLHNIQQRAVSAISSKWEKERAQHITEMTEENIDSARDSRVFPNQVGASQFNKANIHNQQAAVALTKQQPKSQKISTDDVDSEQNVPSKIQLVNSNLESNQSKPKEVEVEMEADQHQQEVYEKEEGKRNPNEKSDQLKHEEQASKQVNTNYQNKINNSNNNQTSNYNNYNKHENNNPDNENEQDHYQNQNENEHQQEQEENDDPNNYYFTQLDVYPKQKRNSTQVMDNIFISIYEDLVKIEEYQKQEIDFQSKKNQNDKIGATTPFKNWSVSVWLLRGCLATRLQRNNLAQNAWHKTTERGYCFYAFQELLQIHRQEGNLKSFLVTLAEILDDIEIFGVQYFNFMPPWIEDQIIASCTLFGIKLIEQTLQELHFEDETVKKCLQKIQSFKGYNKKSLISQNKQENTPSLKRN